jgi:hypothetical protein
VRRDGQSYSLLDRRIPRTDSAWGLGLGEHGNLPGFVNENGAQAVQSDSDDEAEDESGPPKLKRARRPGANSRAQVDLGGLLF